MATKSDFDESAYYRLDSAAAPFAGVADYLNHPEKGWLAVLDVETEIETDTVAIVLGDPETGEYVTLYASDYSFTEELITDAEGAQEIAGDDWDAIDPEPVEDELNEILGI